MVATEVRRPEWCAALIDAELFRWLRVRAGARTEQDLRVQDWWTALWLVRRIPLDQRRPDPRGAHVKGSPSARGNVMRGEIG